MKIFSLIVILTFFSGCFKKEVAPEKWQDWVKKAQERFNEKISVPAALQHIYITLGEGEFYITKTEETDYKLEKISSFDTDEKYVIDFDQEKLIKDGKIIGDTKEPIIVNDRIALNIVFYKEEASSKARIFLYDQEIKNLDKKRKRDFYAYSSKYKKSSTFKKLKKPETKRFGRSDGTTRDFNKIGVLKIKDSEETLSVFAEPGSEVEKVMLMFKDKTSGGSTYGAGRYVVVDLPKKSDELVTGDEVEIDFNYTFNPPCAVSSGFHCPLAQDFLNFKVKAGEKYSKH